MVSIFDIVRQEDKVTLQISSDVDSVVISPKKKEIWKMFFGCSLKTFQFAIDPKQNDKKFPDNLDDSTFYYHVETSSEGKQSSLFLYPSKLYISRRVIAGQSIFMFFSRIFCEPDFRNGIVVVSETPTVWSAHLSR